MELAQDRVLSQDFILTELNITFVITRELVQQSFRQAPEALGKFIQSSEVGEVLMSSENTVSPSG
jgi:hypothetical protein